MWDLSVEILVRTLLESVWVLEVLGVFLYGIFIVFGSGCCNVLEFNKVSLTKQNLEPLGLK